LAHAARRTNAACVRQIPFDVTKDDEEERMIVNDVMSPMVCLIEPGEPIREAARLMGENDVGALPVAENDRLVGMITDRDIAVRAVAAGLGVDTPVREVMSKEILYCYDDEEIEHVARNMGDNKVRRLPVVDRDKRLVGIVSIGDLALTDRLSVTGSAVAEISEPGGAHSQTVH
jgi:CBS domain-containing protein